MRLRISDEIIEIARKHQNVNERIEIYWKAVLYAIEKQIVDERMAEYLDPNTRRKKKMEWNQNSVGHTVSNRVGHTVSKTEWNKPLDNGNHTTKQCGTHCSKQSGTHCLKNSVGHTVKSKATSKKKQITDEDLTIYISNNNLLYSIVCKYIENNKQYWSISYQINKQWKEKYIYSQMKEAEKLVKEIWFKNLNDILEFIPKDDFRSKQILSIAKLNRKNKEWVPYHVVIMDKMKPQKLLQERQQREIELHRQRIAEQIQSFKSEINENEQNGNQKGNYNRRQNISFS